jgi:hypothetical protein
MLFSDIYLIELEIKENGITDLARYASCIDLLLAVDGEGQLRTKLFNKKMISIFQLLVSTGI